MGENVSATLCRLASMMTVMGVDNSGLYMQTQLTLTGVRRLFNAVLHSSNETGKLIIMINEK